MSGRRAREATRHDYMPEELRVLFVGESPPTGGTFFYDANSILFTATREAFMKAMPSLSREPDFLRAFQRMGCYLEDLSLDPIDKLPDKEKRRARTEAVAGLTRRLKGMTPTDVVLVVKGIRPNAEKALAKADITDVPVHALPFPGQWWRADYIAELTTLVKRWKRRGVLNV